jgi:hypothetical protein
MDTEHITISARPEGSFGGRFVDELQRVSGGTLMLRYKVIQDLRRADRERMVRVLRAAHPLLEYAVIQRIRTVETPELLAREMNTHMRATAPGIWIALAPLLVAAFP